ncbi:MAG: class I SAM-dependent methyltransferase [Armatimonadota bacterium]
MSDLVLASSAHRKAKCPICHGVAQLLFVARDYNRRTTTVGFPYYHCQACELIFLSPIPPQLDRYYPSEYYPVPSSLEQLEGEAALECYKIEFVRRFVKSGRVLDVGAGYGRFVYLAHKADYEIDAIEVNSECCDFITNVVGARAIAHAKPEVALADLEPYDVITFWHVVEHLTDPWLVLKAAVRNLKIGGWLIIAMPNPESIQFQVFKQFWAHVDAPRHLQLVPVHLLTRELTSDGRMRSMEVTTVDQGSLDYNYLGWTWSMRNVMQLRGMWRIGGGLAHIVGRFEKVGMRGSCYTVVYQKQE